MRHKVVEEYADMISNILSYNNIIYSNNQQHQFLHKVSWQKWNTSYIKWQYNAINTKIFISQNSFPLNKKKKFNLREQR